MEQDQAGTPWTTRMEAICSSRTVVRHPTGVACLWKSNQGIQAI